MVLAISVVYRGCAILVAWKVVGAEEKGSWQPHWLGLFQSLVDTVSEHWTVIMMSDHGLYAPWLYAKIVSLGWHPFMRIDKQGLFRPVEEGTFRSLEALPETHIARRKATGCSRPRMLSCFARGMVTIVRVLIRGDGLVLGRFVPEPWLSMTLIPKKNNSKIVARATQEAA
jgi:hypothetical protein